MANNVYIGNRYVPVFADPVEWDNLRQYEPLTIVTYQGTAYTSKKTVPVGTALSNTEYWVVTGNYNAQVEQYRQEVVAVSEEIDAVSDRVSVLEDDILVTIGDSYLQGYTHEGIIPNNWGVVLANFLGVSATNHKSSAIGGNGFKNGGYTGQLNTLIGNMTNAEKTRVKWVVVGGCFNDGGNSTSVIHSGMNSFMSVAKNAFPNAKIYAIPFGWECKQLIPSAYDTNRTYKNLADATIAWFEGCINYGFLTGNEVYSVLYNNTLFSADYYHPNANGQVILGAAIYQTIVGSGSTGLVSGYNKSLQNMTAYGGTLNNLQCIAYWVNGRYTDVDVYHYNIIYTPSSPFDISSVNVFGRKIAEYKDAGLATGNHGISIPVTAYVHTTGSGYWELTDASIEIKNNEVWFYTGVQMNEGHGNYLAINGIDKITIFPNTIRTTISNLPLCV